MGTTASISNELVVRRTSLVQQAGLVTAPAGEGTRQARRHAGRDVKGMGGPFFGGTQADPPQVCRAKCVTTLWADSESNREPTDYLPATACAATRNAECLESGLCLHLRHHAVRWVPSSLYTFPFRGLARRWVGDRPPTLPPFTRAISDAVSLHESQLLCQLSYRPQLLNHFSTRLQQPFL